MSTTVTPALVVTGSEAAAACGVDPFRSPVALWTEKLGLAVPREDNEAMRWGNLLEPIVAREVESKGFMLSYPMDGADLIGVKSPEYPWLLGHPDAYCGHTTPHVHTGQGICEIKTTSPWRRGEWDDEQAPPHVVVQAHVYMLLTGLRWTLAACLVGGQKLEIREFDYDEDIASIVLDKTREFLGYVERQEPPPPDGAKSTSDVLARLYPKGTGEVVELSPELYALAREREALREQAKVIEAQMEEREQALKLALGQASVGTFDGRRVVTWTDVERKGYEVQAKSYRAFRVKL